jgi:hypothetical protein
MQFSGTERDISRVQHVLELRCTGPVGGTLRPEYKARTGTIFAASFRATQYQERGRRKELGFVVTILGLA